MTRADNAQRVAELAAQGFNGCQIAERLGLSRSYAYALLTDPDGAKDRARKRQYDESCIDCGVRIDGTTPSKMTGRCRECSGAHVRQLSRQWVLDSFADWEERFGAPPTACDWNPSQARANGMAWKAERYEQTGRPWPSTTLVLSHFGSWNAGRRAAGFETFEPGHYGRDGEDPAVIAETVALYRSGLSCAKVAQRMNVSAWAVYHRLLRSGEPRRPVGRPPVKEAA